MSNVYVTSYMNANGVDQFTLHFSSIVETHTGTNPVTPQLVTTHTGWDFGTQTGTGGVKGGEAFDPSKAPPIGLTVNEATLGVTTNAVVTGFNFEGPTVTPPTKTTPGGIESAPKETFGPLVVNARLGNGSTGLLSRLLSGKLLTSVVLDDRDAQ